MTVWVMDHEGMYEMRSRREQRELTLAHPALGP